MLFLEKKGNGFWRVKILDDFCVYVEYDDIIFLMNYVLLWLKIRKWRVNIFKFSNIGFF